VCILCREFIISVFSDYEVWQPRSKAQHRNGQQATSMGSLSGAEVSGLFGVHDIRNQNV
jgi:hypothetical protein